MGKDEQVLKSINIVYSINKNGFFTIEYWFDGTDYELWLDLYESHKSNLYEYFLYDIDNNIIKDCILNEEYNYYRLESNDERLHDWIEYIPFIEEEGFADSVRKNTNKSWFLR